MVDVLAKVLVIEPDDELRAWDDQLLTFLGYDVRQVPAGSDPIALAERIGAQIIVIGIRHGVSEDRQLVDNFLKNSGTRSIPVVAISSSDDDLIALSSLPNVRQTVLAPFTIKAFETAISHAREKPPGGRPPSRSPGCFLISV